MIYNYIKLFKKMTHKYNKMNEAIPPVINESIPPIQDEISRLKDINDSLHITIKNLKRNEEIREEHILELNDLIKYMYSQQEMDEMSAVQTKLEEEIIRLKEKYIC